MMRCAFLFLCFLFIGSSMAVAELPVMELNLGKDHIDVTTGFNGDTLTIYGLKGQGEQVVLVVKGPAQNITVRKKSEVLGSWINRQHMDFKAIPSFYRVASSGEIDGVIDDAVLNDFQIGLRHLNFNYEGAAPDEAELASFKTALLRNKSEAELFSENLQSVDVLNGRFYRSSFYFPHNVPLGTYSVEGYIFRDGVIVSRGHLPFHVDKVGFSARIFDFARRSPFLYGFLCVFLALYSGWLSHKLRLKLKF